MLKDFAAAFLFGNLRPKGLKEVILALREALSLSLSLMKNLRKHLEKLAKICQ